MMNLRIGRRTALLAAAALAVVSLPFVSAFADESKPAEKPPEEKKEPVLPKAPDFKLMDIDGKERTLAEFKDKWVVLEWTNYSCPFVVKHYKPGAMQALQAKYTAKGVVWLSICSSAEGKQGHLSPAWTGRRRSPTRRPRRRRSCSTRTARRVSPTARRRRPTCA